MKNYTREAPPDIIREMIYYSDGELYFHDGYDKRDFKNRGKPLGYLSGSGYKTVALTIDGIRETYYVHRLIYWLHTNEWPVIVDHKDRNTLNNHIDNLRPGTVAENRRNTNQFSKNNTTGYRGVYVASKNTFKISVSFNRKAYHFSGYKSVETAALARDILVHLLYGDFAEYGISQHNLKITGA